MGILLVNPSDPADYLFTNLWGDNAYNYARGRHGGLDFQGTYWVACQDGIWRRRSYGTAYGLQGQIDFEAGGRIYEATYSHGAAVYPDAGAHVYAGERIGKIGSSGNVTGPHLHFELHRTIGNWYSDFDPLGDIMATLSSDDIDHLKSWVARMKAKGSNDAWVDAAIDTIRDHAPASHTHTGGAAGASAPHTHPIAAQTGTAQS